MLGDIDLWKGLLHVHVVKKNSPHPLNDPSSEGETLSPSSEI